MEDRDRVATQIGREPRAFHRVAVRCPFGSPAVTEQKPYDGDGKPFPTTYYLTCRHLVAAIARIEASGGVERWSARVAADSDLGQSLSQASQDQRALRRALAGKRVGRDGGTSLMLGIGGSHRPESLKCLHAHVAYALARPGYLLGEQILAEVSKPWPADCCCASDVTAGRRP
jgi:uncharacterized protein